MKKDAPLLLPALCLIAGVVVAEYAQGIIGGVILIAAAIIIYMTLLRQSRNPVKGLRLNKFHFIWIVLLFLGTGILLRVLSAPETIVAERSYELCGKVADRTVNTSGDRLTVILNSVKPINPAGERQTIRNTKILVYLDPTNIREGDLVRFSGVVKDVADRRDKLPGNYSAMMKRRGIPYTLRIESPKNIAITGHRATPSGIASNIRDKIEVFIYHTPLAQETKVFLSALLLGDRSMLDQDKRQTFADAGVAHVLALSGMHLGIIALFILGLLLPANIFGLYKARYILTLVILWGYAFLTGFSPTIIRATVMATCVMGAILLERKNTALNSLCTAVILLIVIDPMCIYDIGMQLSAGCVACLILFAEPLNPVDHRTHPRLFKITGAILATLIATFGTWVITAWHFSRFPLNFLPINLIALPLLPWFTGISIIVLLLSAIGINIPLLYYFLDKAYASFHSLAEWSGEGAVNVNIGIETLIIWISGVVLLAWGIHIVGRQGKIIKLSACGILLISLATISLFTPAQPEGFIIGGNHSRIFLTDYTNGEEKEIEFCRGDVAYFESHGKTVAVIDGRRSHLQFPKKFLEPDYLILGSNFRGHVNTIDSLFKPTRIILHYSISRKREKEIIDTYTGTTPLHSLRSNGPLHVFE